MATPKRARATSSTTRSKKTAANPGSESTALPATNGNGNGNGNVEEAIRVRAYQLFEQRGRTHGHDVEDWFRAIAEVSTRAHHSA
jgi:Protein of unknown function (DUF2934)